jgi:hypothetical protein
MIGERWPQTGLLAGYHLSDLIDFSGNSKTLINVGTTIFGTGKFGNCALFGSSNTAKYLYRNDGLSYNLTGEAGFSAWIYIQTLPSTEGDTDFIIDWRSTTIAGKRLALSLKYSSGAVDFQVWDRTDDYNIEGGLDIYDGSYNNSWHLIDVSQSETTLYFYLDGKLILQNTRNPNFNGLSKLTIGGGTALSSAQMFKGNIDEVAFFNYNRSAEEIRNWYNLCNGTLLMQYQGANND